MLLTMEKIKKVYNKNKMETIALNNANLCVNKGEFLAIIGPSGSGKSTLLNILSGLDTVFDGKYILKNKDTRKINDQEWALLRNEIFGFVVQEFALLNNYTVFENIRIPLDYRQHKLSREEKKSRIIKILKELSILDKINKKPTELSGGQKQRVAIGRALVNDPEFILADEPTGSLDSNTGNEIFEILKNLNKKRGKTIIVVTHNIELAKNTCSRILELKDGFFNDI